MAISIKNAEVEQAIRDLARRRSVNLTEAIRFAVVHQLALDARKQEMKKKRMRQAVARFAALPLLDNRTPDEIIGYDAFGLPDYP